MTIALKGCPHCNGDVFLDYKHNPSMGKCVLCSRIVWKHQIPVGIQITGAPVDGKKRVKDNRD